MVIIIQKKTLITCDVIYWMPKHPMLLQHFIWQYDDVMPGIPRTKRFLRYWKDEIKAVIKDVLISETNSEFRSVDLERIFE